MCPSAASTNATLPIAPAAPASSAESSAATVPRRRPSRNLKAARTMNAGRHQRRDLRVSRDCKDCWSMSKLQRCGPCNLYVNGVIDAKEWSAAVLRTGDKRLT